MKIKLCEDFNMNDKRAVAIYCRVARKDDTAIENQKINLQRFAEEKGYNNLFIYSDNGFNGIDSNRPAFNRLNEDISAGLIGIVIVRDISRIYRNQFDFLKWINNIQSKRISLKSVIDDFQLDSFTRVTQFDLNEV
jgi:DNA invertase Pin-like site-specific DNA recombinase